MHTTHDWTIAFRNQNAYTFRRAVNWCGNWDESTKMADRFAKMFPDMQVYYTCTQESELSGYVVKEDVGNILVDSGKRISIVDGAELPDELIQWAAENNIGHVPGDEHLAEFVLYDYGNGDSPEMAVDDLMVGRYCSRHAVYTMRDPDRKPHCLAIRHLNSTAGFKCEYEGYFK